VAGFTLIHGSGQNASSWRDVAKELRDRGHEVSTPDLPKNEPSWNLQKYAAFINDRLTQERPRVVVAHSFSGVFLPLLTDVDLLIFLAAVLPEPHRSVREQFAADAAMFHPEWIAAGPRWFDLEQREALAREFLFHDTPADKMTWALQSVEFFHTQHLVVEPAPFDSWPDTASASVICTNDRTITADWGRRMTLRHHGMALIEMESGHSPQISHAAELSSILERAVHAGGFTADRPGLE
jgi:pimeloyl-ACP methyl ester carboxylesterase